MWKDPIIEDIHRVRREIMAEFDNDLDKYVQHLMEAQARHLERLVSGSPKPLFPRRARKENPIAATEERGERRE